ncbi:MAG: response regulator [Methylococcales bacterium]
MNILISSSAHSLLQGIDSNPTVFQNGQGPVKFHCISSVEEVVCAIKEKLFDCLVIDYFFDDIDVWRLSNLIQSDQMVGFPIPILLLKDSCVIEISPQLADEYHIAVIEPVAFINWLNGQPLLSTDKNPITLRTARHKRTVLIIEDDEDAAYFSYHALSDIYEVEIAKDAESGLDAWQKQRHNLVLLDFMLPDLNGDKVLLKMMETDKNQPVIIMTAFDHPDRNMDVILNGASDYLCKPVDIKKLRTLCADILKRSALFYQMDYLSQKQRHLARLFQKLEGFLADGDVDNALYLTSKIKRHYAPFLIPVGD